IIGASTTDAEIRAATSWALRAELQQIWDMADKEDRGFVQRLMADEVGNRPLHVLHELGHINAQVFCKPSLGGLDGPAGTEIDRSLSRFQDVLGACEKILRTPIYTPYTRFTSRYLWLWCNALPLAMFPIVGPAGTVPVSLIISFFMLGIEDIGSRVEQPFNVMPLWQYCQTVDQSCIQLVRHNEILLNKPRAASSLCDDYSDYDVSEFTNVNSDSLRSFSDPL
ncbi:unnamed protein product, partial [Polarella glacialis]